MFLKSYWSNGVKLKMIDCEYASSSNAQGLIWCDKINCYVSAEKKETCPDYKKKI